MNSNTNFHQFSFQRMYSLEQTVWQHFRIPWAAFQNWDHWIFTTTICFHLLIVVTQSWRQSAFWIPQMHFPYVSFNLSVQFKYLPNFLNRVLIWMQTCLVSCLLKLELLHSCLTCERELIIFSQFCQLYYHYQFKSTEGTSNTNWKLSFSLLSGR